MARQDEATIDINCIDCGATVTRGVYNSQGAAYDWDCSSLFCESCYPGYDEIDEDRKDELWEKAHQIQQVLTEGAWKCPMCIEPKVVTDQDECPRCHIGREDVAKVYL